MKKILIIFVLLISFTFVHAEEEEYKVTINEYNNTITYKGRTATYRLSDNYIEVAFDGCTYIKHKIDDWDTSWAVSENCSAYNDSEDVNKILDAIDAHEKNNATKNNTSDSSKSINVDKKLIISLVIWSVSIKATVII